MTNLGLLSFFKYGNFFLENFSNLLKTLGLTYYPLQLDIVLPVGISFYTFQTLSYTIDVYRGRTKPWPYFLDFALYVTFFPQLVAGPIVRATTFLPQCREVCRASVQQFWWGLNLLLLGLFEKIIVADGLLAPISDKIYSQNVDLAPTFVSAWCGTFAFSGQIFCDFAGYSTCAIGMAMCLGFILPDNFRFPYAALGFSDFWRRWHISLSTWLRDYLYIPLGGNRGGTIKTYINLMSTMLIGGLWHGASWTFVLWGALHGLYLVVERIVLNSKLVSLSIWKGPIGKLAITSFTFVAVCFTWVFFRANSLNQAFIISSTMLGWKYSTPIIPFNRADILVSLGCVALIFLLHRWLRDTTLENAVTLIPTWLWSTLLAVMLVVLALFSGTGGEHAFIYFQF